MTSKTYYLGFASNGALYDANVDISDEVLAFHKNAALLSIKESIKQSPLPEEEALEEIFSQACHMLPSMFMEDDLEERGLLDNNIVATVLMLKHYYNNSFFFTHQKTGKITGATFIFEELDENKNHSSDLINLATETDVQALLLNNYNKWTS